MSRLLNPRMWYLAGLGALALTLDAGMRRFRERRTATTENGRREPVVIESTAAETTAPRTPPTAQRAARPAAASSTPVEGDVTADDLTTIKGIGPAYARRLTAAGITTFSRLAATSPDRLREATRAGAAVKTEEWIAQARLLAH